MRIETRFVGKQLLVRIFPDQLSVETHEHDLTADEVIAGRAFRDHFDAGDEEQKRAAWRELARKFGSRRAAWIARQVDAYQDKEPRHLSSDAWMTAPTVRTLPDRFLISIYRNGVHVPEYDTISAVPISRELGILRDPGEAQEGEPALFDAAAQWVCDFQAAVGKGMAVKIDLREKDPPPFSHVIAVGINGALPPADGAVLVKELLDGHHYKSGLSFLPYGTQTNNTATSKSAHSETADDPDKSYDLEFGADEPPGARSNARQLHRALGLPAESQVFWRVEHCRDEQDSYAKDMQALLWPAIGGQFVRTLLDGVISKDAGKLAKEHFVRYVRARGPLPTVRVGKLPYGFLPVTRIGAQHKGDPDGWAPRAGDSVQLAGHPERWHAFDGHLHLLASRIGSLWLARAQHAELVPRVGAGDPDAELLAVLGMEPRSGSYRLQPFMDERFVGLLLVGLRHRFFGGHTHFAKAGKPENSVNEWVRHWQISFEPGASFLKQLGAEEKAAHAAPLLRILEWGESVPAAGSLVEDPGPYLSALHESGKDAAVSSKALFAQLVQCAFHAEEDPPGLHDVVGGMLATPELDFINRVTSADELATHLEENPRFAEAFRGSGSGLASKLAEKALTQRDSVPGKKFATAAQAAAVLGVEPSALYAVDFDGLLRDGLDLLSHRVDAWMTSFATKRLEAMREGAPVGIHLGAYGWVEDLRPIGADAKRAGADSSSAPGFIHAPSLSQASMAAVMRSVFLHHERGGPQNPFRIDLTSDRVSRALDLLDGVRQGQPLAALLGYQFERALHESELDKYIDEFRKEFPLTAHKEIAAQEGESSEAVSARNVVDGLLVANGGKEKLKKLVPSGSDNGKMERHIDALRDALDATGDLLMTEAIYQSVRGNFERAGAALEAAAGSGPPPELESICTPTSGVGLRHRVCLVLPCPERAGSGGGPRAAAEPQLNAWVGAIVGDLGAIGCLATWGADGRAALSLGRDAQGAAESVNLDLDPLDFLYMSAFPPEGAETQLEQRIKFHVRQARGLAPEEPVRLDFGPTGLRSIAEAAEIGRAILGLLGQSSYLRPDALCRPEDTPADPFAAVDMDELRGRVESAQATLEQGVVNAVAEERSETEALTGLLAADRYGIQGAMPAGPGDGDLGPKRTAVFGEATARLEKSRKLLAEALPASADRRVDGCIQAMKALFGAGFVVLPQFKPPEGDRFEAALAQNGRLGDDEEDRVMLWLQQVAETHPPVRRLENVLMAQQAWAAADRASLRLRVAQLPYCEHRPWQALSDAEVAARRGDATGAQGDCADPPHGRPRGVTSLAVLAPGADTLGLSRVAGLMVDQWSETVPLDEVTTGIALHYDAPGSQAPQAVLLAVPAHVGSGWTPQQLRDIVCDTADLMRMRLVDPDALGEFEDPRKQDDQSAREQEIAARARALRDKVQQMEHRARALPRWAAGAITHGLEEKRRALEGEIAAHQGPTPLGVVFPALFMPLDPKQPPAQPELTLPTLQQWQEKLK